MCSNILINKFFGDTRLDMLRTEFFVLFDEFDYSIVKIFVRFAYIV